MTDFNKIKRNAWLVEMDLDQLISQEAARRAGPGSGRGIGMPVYGSLDAGAGIGGIAPKHKQQSWASFAGDALLRLIPRAAMVNKVMNAGPVADGTLEHAMRMGWMR